MKLSKSWLRGEEEPGTDKPEPKPDPDEPESYPAGSVVINEVMAKPGRWKNGGIYRIT